MRLVICVTVIIIRPITILISKSNSFAGGAHRSVFIPTKVIKHCLHTLGTTNSLWYTKWSITTQTVGSIVGVHFRRGEGSTVTLTYVLQLYKPSWFAFRVCTTLACPPICLTAWASLFHVNFWVLQSQKSMTSILHCSALYSAAMHPHHQALNHVYTPTIFSMCTDNINTNNSDYNDYL